MRVDVRMLPSHMKETLCRGRVFLSRVGYAIRTSLSEGRLTRPNFIFSGAPVSRGRETCVCVLAKSTLDECGSTDTRHTATRMAVVMAPKVCWLET